MKLILSRRKKFIIFLFVIFLVMFVSYMQAFFLLPGEITLVEGQELVYDFKSPFFVSIKADKMGVIKLNNSEIAKEGRMLRLSNPLSFTSLSNGRVNLSWSIFGLIPLRTMQVDVIPNKTVVACGNTIGVKLKINGILVIGLSDVEIPEGKRVQPMKQSGIRVGDLIQEINHKKVNSIEGLLNEVERSQGQPINIGFKRGEEAIEARIVPARSADDQKYHLGIWVRESTAGIGTLTFYDPKTKRFGALGHGITDIDTGTLLPIGKGDVLESRILAVKKGKTGSPGELRGVFVEDKNKLGVIKTNCIHGIYGTLNPEAIGKMPQKAYPIALRAQIKEGAASILSNIDGKKVDEYAIEITKVSRNKVDGSKGMIIKVTDPRLLDSTGGIVQGMSGSPILQNGKIVGAVTHVLVNDPTRGYGIFIENMLKNIAQKDSLADQQAG